MRWRFEEMLDGLRQGFTLRRLLTVLAVCAAALAAGAGGYMLGTGGGADLEQARSEGAAAGEARGAAEGEDEGYIEGYEEGRSGAYSESFAEAFERAYRQVFKQAGRKPPDRVEAAPKG